MVREPASFLCSEEGGNASALLRSYSSPGAQGLVETVAKGIAWQLLSGWDGVWDWTLVTATRSSPFGDSETHLGRKLLHTYQGHSSLPGGLSLLADTSSRGPVVLLHQAVLLPATALPVTGTWGLRGAHEGTRIRSAFPNSLLVALFFLWKRPFGVPCSLWRCSSCSGVVRPPSAGPGGKGCWDGAGSVPWSWESKQLSSCSRSFWMITKKQKATPRWWSYDCCVTSSVWCGGCSDDGFPWSQDVCRHFTCSSGQAQHHGLLVPLLLCQQWSQRVQCGLTPGPVCGLDLLGSSPCGRGSSVVFYECKWENIFFLKMLLIMVLWSRILCKNGVRTGFLKKGIGNF